MPLNEDSRVSWKHILSTTSSNSIFSLIITRIVYVHTTTIVNCLNLAWIHGIKLHARALAKDNNQVIGKTAYLY